MFPQEFDKDINKTRLRGFNATAAKSIGLCSWKNPRLRYLNTQLRCWEEGYFVSEEIFQVYQVHILKKKKSLLSVIGSKVLLLGALAGRDAPGNP